mgnify:CR=1 FL=1
MVGLETGDDAGVYQLSDDMALVMTADYIREEGARCKVCLFRITD